MIKTLIALLFSLGAVDVCGAASSPACAAGNAGNPVIEEELYALGFSDDRKSFAYVKQGFEEGMGSYYWGLTVQDSNSQDVIEHTEFIGDQKKQKQPPDEFFKKIEQSLKKRHINLVIAPRIYNLPQKGNGSRIDAFIVNAGEVENDGIKTVNRRVFLVDENFNPKKIGEVSEVNFFGHQKIYSHKIEGIIKDPKSDAFVLVVPFARHENEESDFICMFSLFGADPIIDKRPINEKIQFIKSVIKDHPERTDAYKALGDSYWEANDHGKAVAAYKTYVARMKASGGAIPEHVQDRVGED